MKVGVECVIQTDADGTRPVAVPEIVEIVVRVESQLQLSGTKIRVARLGLDAGLVGNTGLGKYVVDFTVEVVVGPVSLRLVVELTDAGAYVIVDSVQRYFIPDRVLLARNTACLQGNPIAVEERIVFIECRLDGRGGRSRPQTPQAPHGPEGSACRFAPAPR